MAWEECLTCGKSFAAGWAARDAHCNALGHEAPEFECASCPKWFMSRRACEQHMDDTNHWPYVCQFCDESWPTREQCDEHEADEHPYCEDCDRTFQSQSALNAVSIDDLVRSEQA